MKISKSSPDLWTKLPECTLIRTVTTHLYSTRAWLILLQCYNASYYLCSLDITLITMFTNLVIQAVNLWNVTLSRHFHLLCLQLQYQPLVIQKHAWLIEIQKERKTLHDLTCHATVHRHMIIADVCHYANAKIPEISVGSSDQIIFGITSGSGPVISVDQNFLTLPFLTNRFIIAILLQTYVANLEKEYKLVRADYSWLIAWFHRMWLTQHVINTILGHYAHFGFFGGNLSRLAARACRLEK